jgi:endonuclease YncB( thermonuclease family)
VRACRQVSGDMSPRRSAFVAAMLLAMPRPAPAEVVGHAVVIDADTLEIGDVQVRLSGIDAPELGQRCSTSGDVLARDSATYSCGEQAVAALANRIGDDPIACETSAPAGAEIVMARCRLNDEDLGAWLVHSGWARAYPRSVSPYLAHEQEAQAGLAGIWRGDFLDPWDWRQQRAEKAGGNGRILIVKVDAANARAVPTKEGLLLTTLRRGEQVEQLGKTDAWYHVRLPDGTKGWIFKELLEPADTRVTIDR